MPSKQDGCVTELNGEVWFGLVTDVLIDRRTLAGRYLTLCANGYFGHDVLAPVSSVRGADDAVFLALTRPDVTEATTSRNLAARLGDGARPAIA